MTHSLHDMRRLYPMAYREAVATLRRVEPRATPHAGATLSPTAVALFRAAEASLAFGLPDGRNVNALRAWARVTYTAWSVQPDMERVALVNSYLPPDHPLDRIMRDSNNLQDE